MTTTAKTWNGNPFLNKTDKGCYVLGEETKDNAFELSDGVKTPPEDKNPVNKQ